uniref:Uncharacterized protein n=1 Tax=Verrucosispora sp. MS100047 TaxID=1410949 RepID=A0A097CSQ8_9ACTN|nr:hypothetical protein VASRM7_441 [Verrucosispora sp. MS100047]
MAKKKLGALPGIGHVSRHSRPCQSIAPDLLQGRSPVRFAAPRPVVPIS